MDSPIHSPKGSPSESESRQNTPIYNKKLDSKLPKIPGDIEIEESSGSEGIVDISKLHKSILVLFKKTKKKRLAEVDSKLKVIKNTEVSTAIEKEQKKKNMSKWKSIKNDVESEEDMEIFNYQGNEIIEQYINTKDGLEKERIVAEYLDFARNIIKIEQKIIADEISTEIVSSGGNGKPAKEDDKTERENFSKAFQSHQAKRAVNIPEDLLKRLDKYFSSWDHLEHLTRDKIEKVKLLKNGKRKGTNRGLMREALSYTGNATYYDRENSICFIYWKWKLKDYSNIETQIMIDFDMTQEAYRWMKKTNHPLMNRKSNLNIGYRLWQHLRARGDKCKKTEFKIVGGRDILIDYDKIWEVMVEMANIELKKAGYEPMIFLPTV